MIIEKTWPYGTTRRGFILQMTGEFQLVRETDAQEAHVLLGSARDLTAREGQSGTLTFTEGGPTGGFWKFLADKPEKEA